MDGRDRSLPIILLAGAMLASAALLLALQWNLTFFNDTWAFLLWRQGPSVNEFFWPHNEHLVVIPVAISKLCIALFGMGNARAELFPMILCLIGAAWLLFVYIRRRVGSWLALIAVVPVLFLGSSWMILLWPFEIEFSGALMMGLATLLLLERGDRRGDALACLSLTLAIGFGSLGIPFAVATFVEMLLKRRTRGLLRLYMVAIPLVLYVIWYLKWGYIAPHYLTLHNVLASPHFVFDGFASSLAGLFGLTVPNGTEAADPQWGRPLLVVLVALAVIAKRRRPGIPSSFWPVAAAGVAYWALAAFNFVPGREAASNRYVYAGTVFLLLMAADLFRGVRISRQGYAVIAGIAVLAIGPNLAQMKEGADILREQTSLTLSNLGAIEIARRTVPPALALNSENAGTMFDMAITPGSYFEAVDDHGSPAYTPAEMEAAPEVDKHWADVLLSRALPVAIISRLPASGPQDVRRCVRGSEDEGSASTVVPVAPGLTEIWIPPGPSAGLAARRFAAAEYPVNLGEGEGGTRTLLKIPRDKASQTWYLQVTGPRRPLFCRR